MQKPSFNWKSLRIRIHLYFPSHHLLIIDFKVFSSLISKGSNSLPHNTLQALPQKSNCIVLLKIARETLELG